MTDITAPYALDALDTIRQSHRQKATATLYPATGDPLTLVVNDGHVTFSEDWSPHVQVTLSCGGPLDLAALALVDPRGQSRLEVTAGYVYPGGQDDVHVLATVYLQERRLVSPGDGLELTASSAEMFSQDVLWMEATQTKTFIGVHEALGWLLSYAGAGSLSSEVGMLYRPDLVGAVVLEQGRSLWEVIAHVTSTAGLWLYVDSAGAWTLRARPAEAAETSVHLSGAIVTRADDVLSRNEYYSAAVVRYTWQDSTGQDQEMVGTWALPAAPGEKGRNQKTILVERTGAASQYVVDQVAQAIVRNLSTRGDSYVVDAVAAYWLRPGDTVQVALPTGGTARHICKSVAFHLGSGSMTVTTREPSNLGV